MPDGRVVEDFYQIELVEYVLIFAQTTEGQVVMERHYKHGVRRVILALPAGYVEPGEEPLAAAKRELLEETGYGADDWQQLGSYVVNGNQGCGKAHIVRATGARWKQNACSGDLEEVQVLLLTPDEAIGAIADGQVATLGSVAAIALALRPEFLQEQAH